MPLHPLTPRKRIQIPDTDVWEWMSAMELDTYEGKMLAAIEQNGNGPATEESLVESLTVKFRERRADLVPHFWKDDDGVLVDEPAFTAEDIGHASEASISWRQEQLEVFSGLREVAERAARFRAQAVDDEDRIPSAEEARRDVRKAPERAAPATAE